MMKFQRVISIFLFLLILSSCSTSDKKTSEPLVDDKYSLKEDREKLDQLRAHIPEEVKSANDEKAFMDNLMEDLSQTPTEVRNRFSSYLNKKRDQFNKDMTQVREDFSRSQKEERENFSREQDDARKNVKRKQMTGDERRVFYDDLEFKRKNFFGGQRERRDRFEADSRDKRKNFDDYIKSKQDEFNHRLKEFMRQYDENLKLIQKQSSKLSASQLREKIQLLKLEEEYDLIRQKQPVMLECGAGIEGN